MLFIFSVTPNLQASIAGLLKSKSNIATSSASDAPNKAAVPEPTEKTAESSKNLSAVTSEEILATSTNDRSTPGASNVHGAEERVTTEIPIIDLTTGRSSPPMTLLQATPNLPLGPVWI